MCRHEVPVGHRDGLNGVTVERYASCYDGQVEVAAVDIRVEIVATYSPDDAETPVEALRRAVEFARTT